MEELELSVELDELEGGTGAVADLLGGPVGLVTALLSNLDLLTHLEARGRSVVLIKSINQFNYNPRVSSEQIKSHVVLLL